MVLAVYLGEPYGYKAGKIGKSLHFNIDRRKSPAPLGSRKVALCIQAQLLCEISGEPAVVAYQPPIPIQYWLDGSVVAGGALVINLPRDIAGHQLG